MTERNDTAAEGQTVCPFVAFDDDRDYRSSVPDHRHRCFAESPAASRALAHQAAYCLSAAFPSCPTFVDWARREAAPPKDEPIRTVREAPKAPREAHRTRTAADRPGAPQAAPSTPPRSRRSEWTAPPPWVRDSGATAPGRPVDVDGGDIGKDADSPRDAAPARDEADAGPGLGAWSGTALGSIGASGIPDDDEPSPPVKRPAGVARELGSLPVILPTPGAPAFLAGREPRPGGADGAPIAPADLGSPRGEPRGEPSRRRAVGYTPGDPSRRRVPARGRDRERAIERLPDRAADRGPERAIVDPAAPSWERPRRFEAYPSLKSSGSGLAALPRPVLYGLIVLVVGIALFAAPFLLRGLTSGDGGATASSTPAANGSPVASSRASATPVPSPSPTIYTVKAGDLLSRIATRFGITVDQIVKANPQIKNPDKLAIGDQLVIPPAVAPAITDGTITTAP